MTQQSLYQQIILVKDENGNEVPGKFCSICNLPKSLNKFGAELRRPTGKQAACLECFNESQKGRRTKDYVRHYNLKTLYGIGLEDYNNLYNQQEGKCSICKNWFEELVVDHNHSTGKIRELLCKDCNTGIGHLKENIKILKQAIEYLEKYNG